MTQERVDKLDKLGFVWQRPRVNTDAAVAAGVSIPVPAVDGSVEVAPEGALVTEGVAPPGSEIPDVVEPVVDPATAESGLPQVSDITQ